MVLTTVEAVENSIKTLCQTKGIRVQNFFIDYDKLRSGFVTGWVCTLVKVLK